MGDCFMPRSDGWGAMAYSLQLIADFRVIVSNISKLGTSGRVSVPGQETRSEHVLRILI